MRSIARLEDTCGRLDKAGPERSRHSIKAVERNLDGLFLSALDLRSCFVIPRERRSDL